VSGSHVRIGLEGARYRTSPLRGGNLSRYSLEPKIHRRDSTSCRDEPPQGGAHLFRAVCESMTNHPRSFLDHH
jgi:hypothetical protein